MIIRGKVLEQSKKGFVPVEGAVVAVSGIWRTLPEVVNQKAALPNMASLHPPLYRDRGEGTPCEMGKLKSVENDRKVFLHHAPQGTTKIRMSDVENLKPSSLVRIDGNRPDRAEVLAIAAIEPTTADNQPAWVTVDWPLMWEHPAQTMIERLEPEWSGIIHTVRLEGHKGESCVFLDSTDDLVTDAYVKIGKGSGKIPVEYHRLALFSTKSQQEGRYQFPLLQRVARLTITANKGRSKNNEQTWQPDYSLLFNQVDIVIKSP
jgi:hypothetical protein